MTETTRDGEPEQLLCSSQHTRRPDGNHEAKTRGTTLVLSSLTRFAALVANHSLRLREERLGSSYLLCDCHSYRVFRETVSPLTAEAPTVVEVGFRLRFIGSAAVAHRWFQRLCILTTPF